MIKSVLVREIVNSDVGESRELANLSGGFRDCSTNNVITCTRIEAKKSLSKNQDRTSQTFSCQLQAGITGLSIKTQGSVLGPMFYNIFSSDLFHCIPSGKLYSYTDDCQIYDSHMESNELDKLIQNYVTSVNQWFRINGMISNPSKHQAMVLGNKLHHRFSFPTKDSLELFGMTIDQDLNFDKHIVNICKKVNDQFNVMKRFSNLVSKHTIMLLLYRNFIVPRLNYCADIWHFCGARNTKKLEDLNKRILRFILNEHNLSYSELLEITSQASLYNKRLASMLTTCYKCIHYERCI